MPINAYTGLMGSGKSYEVVANVIVPAVRDGRRVVTNVDGIDGPAIQAYCNEMWGTPLDRCGEVVHCRNEDVAKPDFFPYGTDIDTFVRPGDLVCIDEAYRFWGVGTKICREHAIFFREHRHYVDAETKIACDLVLMTQDIGDLNRTLKVVVELTARTTKLKSVGLHKAYKLEMWEGYRTAEKSRLSIMNKRYDPAIFPLYSSYKGGAGTEVQVDGRQNILKQPKMILMFLAPVVLLALTIFMLSRFFGHHAKSAEPAAASPSIATTDAAAAAPAVSSAARPALSSAWALAGTIRTGGHTWVVLRGEGGRVRLEHPSMFAFDGDEPLAGTVDGERVTRFSGPAVSFGGSDASKAAAQPVSPH